MTETQRAPYVGAGEDGARRSAQIDRDEADGLSWMDERKDRLIDSAVQWEEQAYRLMLERMGERPTMEEVRAAVGNESWLAAFAMLDLSAAVANDAARFTQWARVDGSYSYSGEGEDKVSTFHPDPQIDWDAWVASVETDGRGWSSTEHRLYELVAALVAEEPKPVQLRGVLDSMGSWERDVLDILVQWASGGNNRDRAGRQSLAGGRHQ